jgi:hypothetical protein
MMATAPARVPTPSDVDELANHLARAMSLLDEIKPRELPLDDWRLRGESRPAAKGVEPPQHLTVAEIGVMFLAADEALDAADTIRDYGEQIIAALPALAGRDDGGTYASRFAAQPRLASVPTAEEASD